MYKKIFITRKLLDRLLNEKRVSIDGNIMTFHSKEAIRYLLTPAVKFLSIDSRPDDPNGLVGKIMTSDILEEKGVDVYMDSAVYRDDAYKVEPGFAGEMTGEAGEGPEPGDEEKSDVEIKSDEELLADFFLKNL